MPLPAGARLGPYEVLSPLGQGGMGEVYRAKDTRLDRTVALKILSASASEAPQRVERFRQEARAISRLSNPHICTLYDVGEQDGTFFLVMEHLQGRTLAKRLEEGPLAVDEVLRHGAEIAEALDAAHRAGVVHRDLKPANVMLTREGVKLLDFGLARLRKAEGPLEGSTASLHLTKEGMALGTVPYMAPEQIEGKATDARTDVFAFGSVLFEMATGQRPFQAESQARLIVAILRDEPRSLASLQPLAPPALDRMVRTCLAKDPDDRWQSARDLARELQGIAESGSIERAPAEAGEKVPAARAAAKAARRAIWLGGVLAAILVAVAVGLIVYRPPPPPGAGPRAIRSLAVLPLENLSREAEQDYLVDGMTEALITRLAQIGSVKVISRTSVMRYKGTEKPVREVAQELGVQGVIEGSVLRVGERVRISAQLIDGATDAHLWAKDYEGDLKDVLALQAQVAGAIAGEIRAALTPAEHARLQSTRTVDPEAYQAYLRGRYLLSKGSLSDIKTAADQFRAAVDRDPSFAPAYAGLALAYLEVWGDEPAAAQRLKLRAAARRAIEIDPQLADGYVPLAWATVAWDWDWAEGERLFRKALELKPNDAESHRRYGDYLQCTGRNDEAIAETRRARELDPFSAIVDYQLGSALYLARRYDEAIAVLQAPREGDPYVAHIYLGLAYIQKGEHQRAIAEFRKLRELTGGITASATPLAIGYAAAGRRAEALALLPEAERASEASLEAFGVALVYTQLGDKDRAFAWLEKSYQNREWFMMCLRAQPALDPIRSDPRYQALVERMRFPPWGQPAEPGAPAR